MKRILLLLITLSFYACVADNPSVVGGETKTLQLSHDALTISVDQSEKITILSAPQSGEEVVWTSDDENIATVFHGLVTAHQSGTTTISVVMGDEVATCTVTVPEREYKMVWQDEFDGNTLNLDNWTYEVNGNGGGNQELQYYTDRIENIRVQDGKLIIEARKEEYEGKGYTSARIVTKNKRDFRYGKVEARLKVPSGRGTWPAFWMLGYGRWPDAGEIDIMEHVGYQPNVFHCALHTKNKNGLNGQNQHAEQNFDYAVADQFHTITMEWVENEFMGFDRIHIYVDGKLIKTFAETTQLQDAGDWPFNDKFFIILNLAIGGSWGGVQGVDDSMFDTPVLYEVDYVRVYQLAEVE
ncbi:family 16 glycosylhydrolase [Flammeovirga aprica]|uniref:Family 16 glycosylhydrolase n=1 Tax=Flammeovirga aprica JL-4 TaxID=694437 RepID=A0A7X9P224_9BACT|nr:family 16 glycosylhydrolase [Flammeovirga aprica]NME68123.1 family 16 glycosylhydrolase [Flammeovirga aprica JL-4]